MGYKLKYCQVQRKGQPSSAYSLENTIPEKFLENNLFSKKLFHDHCTSFDLYMNSPVGTKLNFMGTYMDVKGSSGLVMTFHWYKKKG